MKRILAAAAFSLLALPSFAALKEGEKAPLFTVQASLAGKEFTFSLADALKQGPVVLYFYPAAFTKGCTIEARAFAEAIDKFKSYGATVIGMSNDTIETLNKFSTSECQGKFPVGADAGMKVTKAYDAVLLKMTNYANRTSYVIAPSGQILFEMTDMDPLGHVDNTLATLKKWADQNKTK